MILPNKKIVNTTPVQHLDTEDLIRGIRNKEGY